jgi:cobalamin biosynthesis Mg chelatase CobN
LRTKPESDTGSKRTRSGAEPAKTGGISRFLDRISDDNSGSVLSDKERSRTRTVSTDQPQSRADRKASGRSGIEGLRATISGNGNGGVNGSSSLSSNGNNNGNGNGLREKQTLRDQLNKAREATGAKQKKGGPILLLVLLAVIASILVGVVFGGWYMLIRSP